MPRIWRVVLLGAAATACATAQPRLSTPSGRPEITIAGATRQAVANYIADSAAAKGFTIVEMTDSRVRMENQGGMREALLIGSSFNTTPVYRYTYTLLDAAGGVRVLLDSKLVTIPPSVFETPTNFAQGRPAKELQSSLERMRESFERAANKAPPWARQRE